jgi:hypothetical protein
LKPEQDKARSFALLNKNLCNYPLARDARVKLKWWRSKKTRQRWCYLSEQKDKQIRIKLPGDVSRHAPTAFDMNVLFLLLAEAKRWNSREFEFKSRSDILRKLKLGVDHNNLHRLNDSLAFWSAARVWFENWYHSRKGNSGKRSKHAPLELPPAIRPVGSEKRVWIFLSSTWWDLGLHYAQKTPLPLPSKAAAQNLVLCLLVSMDKPRRVRELCRKIGLNHTTRGRALERAIKTAQAYFRANECDLLWETNGRTITFTVTLSEQPLATRVPEKQQKAPVKRKPLPRQKPPRPEPRQDSQKQNAPIIIGEEYAVGEDGHRYLMYELDNGEYVDADEFKKQGVTQIFDYA